MTETVTVEVLEDFYDAGASTYRHAGETFEIEREFAENNPRLVEPVDDEADGGDENEEDEDDPLADRDPEQLTETERRIDAADYQTLRQVAGQLGGVDGRGSEDELRVALHTDVDDERVDEAFAAVEDGEDDED